MSDGRVPESGKSKPSKRDPWRWVCPECGDQVYQSPASRRYWCPTCGRGWLRRELVDARRG